MGEKLYLAGTVPGAGTYKCTKCPYTIEIVDGEELEICPVCGAEEYTKIA